MSPGTHELWNRRTAAVAILIVWIAALAWMVDRHYLGDRADNPGVNPRWPVPPGSAFHAVNLAGRQIGLSTMTVDTLGEELRVTDLTTIDLPRVVADTPRRTTERTEAFYTRGLQLQRFQSDLLTEHGRLRILGLNEGDSLLRLINEVPGEPTDTQWVRLRRPVILPAAVPLVAASRGLPRPGSRLNLEVFDPIERELRVERMLVAAESVFVVGDSAELNTQIRRWEVVHSDTIRAWRLDWLEHGLPKQLWVDGAGLPVRLTYPLGAVLDRSAFEMVQTNFRMRPPPSYDTSAAAPRFIVTAPPAKPRVSMSILAQLVTDGRFPAGIAAMSDGWQTQVGDTFFVGVDPRVTRPESVPTVLDPAWSMATPDSSIALAARAIVGRDTAPARAGELLVAAVRKRIKSRHGEVRFPASQVLARGTGSEQEQVNLLVSMAMALGLHARPAWGLVQRDGDWILRPWAEIWTDSWTPFDPAAPGHDAGRLRLGTGGSSRFLTLVTHAGNVRLRVLEEKQ